MIAIADMLSVTSDYAIRAMLLLAQQPSGTAMTAAQIAAATGAPRNYTAKVLNLVARAGIVTSSRGPAGGFALASSPSRLTLARIVDLFESGSVNPHCLLGAGPCDPAQPCRTHSAWDAIQWSRRAPLLSTTIADLLDGRVVPFISRTLTELHHDV